jgi:hypothetical protein
LSNGHVAKVAARTAAEAIRTTAVANAAHARADSEADARHAYFAALAGPAGTYADDRAQAEQIKGVRPLCSRSKGSGLFDCLSGQTSDSLTATRMRG